MNTQSDNTPESAGVSAPRLQRLADPAVLLVGATRVMGEPFDLRRATDCRRSRVIRFFCRLVSSARSPAVSDVA